MGEDLEIAHAVGMLIDQIADAELRRDWRDVVALLVVRRLAACR